MLALVLALQIQTAAPRLARISEPDSLALVQRVRDAEFFFMWDWRYIAATEGRAYKYSAEAATRLIPSNVDPSFVPRLPGGGFGSGGTISFQIGNRAFADTLWSGCNFLANVHRDIEQHRWPAHTIKAPGRLMMSQCPVWIPPNWFEPPDEARSVDAAFTLFPSAAADTIRFLRIRLLRLVDSASRRLPGDGWLTGQRVRLHLDQGDTRTAMRAASTECESADFWWCFALQGFVEHRMGDLTRAAATFDRARKFMPDSVRCDWDDVGMFLEYSGRVVYEKLTCAQRDSINVRAWWLADPLFLENGNERRTEHYARHVLVDLHGSLEIDEHWDWRENYQGPAVREMILRYGWPTETLTGLPEKWRRGNTKSVFLGDWSAVPWYPDGCEARCFVKPVSRYWGPQFHTFADWETTLDPFHATDRGWDLAAPRDGKFWDTSWWAKEFYRRDAGALVPLASQSALFRRQQTAILVAAMEWDTVAYLAKPREHMIAAALVSKGPNGPSGGITDTMSGKAPRPLVTRVPSGDGLLAIEMIPRNASGAAARTRMGVTVPPPLSAIRPGELALSDIVLASVDAGQEAPTSMAALLPRMLGSTLLRDPGRVALFWELYGLGTGDTVDVDLRLIRRDEAGTVAHFLTLLGLASAREDTITTRWREPRPGEPSATVEGGVTIRPRGIVLDMSAYKAGLYELAILVRRGTQPPAIGRREFRIERR